jgi:hypothetical protein
MLNRRSERRSDIVIKDIYETPESSYFTQMSNILANQIDNMSLKLRHFAQELGILKDLAQKSGKFIEENEENLIGVDKALENVSEMDSKMGKILYSYTLLAKELDSHLEDAVALLPKAHSEASKIYYLLHDYEEIEHKSLEQVMRDKAIHAKISPALFIWQEDCDNYKVFRNTRLQAKYLKAKKNPSVEYSDSIESRAFQHQHDRYFECNRDNKKGTISCNTSTEHIFEVFAYAAQTLANINNLQKIILYLKLSFEKLDTIFKAIHKQARVKLEYYFTKGILAEENKKKMWKSSVYAQILDDLIGIQKHIENEVSKLNTHISHLPAQIAHSQTTCMPINEPDLAAKQSLFEKINQFMGNCTKLLNIIKFMNKSEYISRNSIHLPTERSEEEIEQCSYKLLCSMSSKDTIKQIEFSKKLSANLIYKMMHLRSTILKKFQPHHLAIELFNIRKDLSSSMLRFIESENSDPFRWSKNVRVLICIQFDFNSMENKVHHSYAINQAGYHSYNSSWELQTDDEIQEVRDSPDIFNPKVNSWSSSSEASSSVSESSFSCVIESDSEFIEKGPIDLSVKKAKFDVKLSDGMKKHLKEAKINKKSLAYLTNKLNKQVKDIHNLGLKGWKRKYKKLKHKEERIDLLNEAMKSRSSHDFFNTRSRSLAPTKTFRPITPLLTVKEASCETSSQLIETQDRRRTRRVNTLFSINFPNSNIQSRYCAVQTLLSKSPQPENCSKSTAILQEAVKTSRSLPNSATIFNNFLPGTSDSHRLGEGLKTCLEKMSNSENPQLYNAINSLQNRHSSKFQRKIRYLQQDRNMSPLDKLSNIRNEFDRLCATDRRTRGSGNSNSKDVHLMSLI